MRALLFGLPLLLLGCGGDAADPGAMDAARARQLGQVAKEIRVQPELADAALQPTGLSRAQFEQALYVIAADPALSKAYTEAL